jgi:hypothetical protein
MEGGGVQDDGGALFWPDGGAKCGKKLLIITEIHFSVLLIEDICACGTTMVEDCT